MIKVDLPGGLTHVNMRDASPNIAPGQRILIMGYPGMAPDVIVGRASADLFNRRSQVFTVPSPTSTEGSIGRVITANNRSQDDFIEGYFSTIGEYYQISGSSPGAGNSGGPVFDKEGNVIGLFTMGPSTLNMSYAVPIKFGMDLMTPNRRTVMN
jgi:S1-C subfamily serine protease